MKYIYFKIIEALDNKNKELLEELIKNSADVNAIDKENDVSPLILGKNLFVLKNIIIFNKVI